MRSVINTVANVTTSAIANRLVRTVMADVDVARASSHDLRLYHVAAHHAEPAQQRWAQKPFAGKQKPAGPAMSAGTGPSLGGGSELLSRCSRRETSLGLLAAQRRRPRVSSCLVRS